MKIAIKRKIKVKFQKYGPDVICAIVDIYVEGRGETRNKALANLKKALKKRSL
jgi:hypothetical protein